MKKLFPPVLSIARSALVILAVLFPATTTAAGAPDPAKGNRSPKSESASAGTPGEAKLSSSPITELKKSDNALKKLFARRAPSWSIG